MCRVRLFIWLFSLGKPWGTSLVAQTVKRLSTMRDTGVQSLGWEDPLEKEMAIHSSTLAWKIPWTQEPGRLQSMGSQRVVHDWATSLSLSSLEVFLWTFPLALLLQCRIFGLLYFHFHLILCIFWYLFCFLLWLVSYSAACCSASICWNF